MGGCMVAGWVRGLGLVCVSVKGDLRARTGGRIRVAKGGGRGGRGEVAGAELIPEAALGPRATCRDLAVGRARNSTPRARRWATGALGHRAAVTRRQFAVVQALGGAEGEWVGGG